MKFDISPVGVGVSAERKKQARHELMSSGNIQNNLPVISEHVSSISKKLLCDIIESIAKLAIKFNTYGQMNSNVSVLKYSDLKLNLRKCEWSWNAPAQPQRLLDEYENNELAQEICLAQRQSIQTFAYLKHILEIHDKQV